ncbi:NUDIX hydrolase [Blastochloris viridis]|uniref:MutT/nudix family protein n=1 Tax=Blastochloris viridis TaxID=1079 RepID=A0A0H5BEW8_BLAVI|nr:NUDIX hydrolase [Blastochloris viridis]ALK09353.1 NUDIX domain protein [Blastochloris viridis]BAS00768.1 MutT/nudix family protein [Blastochloris viridis]CUU42016.1 NUDIX domain protein [Blastochloris viridis]
MTETSLSETILSDRSTRLTSEALRLMKPTPYRRPRDAATLILLDRTGPTPKVLLGRRHVGHSFMPGVFVFPGGSVDAADRRMAAHGGLGEVCSRRLADQVVRPSPARVRALALAAIREMFEETGLFVAVKAEGLTVPTPGDAPAWTAFAERALLPTLAPLRFVARAITPPGRSKRFDTRFFAADATAVIDRVDGVIGPDAELVELAWVPLGEAPSLKMPMITRIILEELNDQVTAGFPDTLPVPFYRMQSKIFGRSVLP